MAGLELDPWEEFVLAESLGERKDGRWAAFEVAVVCPRQNGKNEILTARQLVGLFLLEEPLQIHSAHQWDTSLEALERLLNLIEETPQFDRRVKKVSRTNGKEGIELKGGQRIRFRTRTKGGGRGFTGDVIYLDEAMEIAEAFHGALFPTVSARSVVGDPQVWYTGSAVDQWVHDNGVVFARVRERGLAGEDQSLAFFEWSVEADGPEWVSEETATDPEMWAQANPGLGIRIAAEHVAREQRSMDPRTFAVERLGVGDWPSTDADEDQVIDPQVYGDCTDTSSEARDPVVFAFDVTPNRSAGAIGMAGQRKDGNSHLEVIEHGAGTGWMVDRLVELDKKWSPAAIVCDDSGPAASLIPALEERGVKVETVNAKEHAQACGRLFDAFEQETVRHLDTAELRAAVRGAATRPLGEAWAWSRKNSTVDISPLVACTLAFGHAAPETGAEWYSRNRIEAL
jgi:phage terminase large subunit-like protein